MKQSNLRKPAVAGQFYLSSSKGLKEQIDALVDKKAQRMDVIACLLPHAGYMYSGRVAALTVSRINIKKKIILLGPNHTGYGAPFSIMTEGDWKTPLGQIQINTPLARNLLRQSRHLKEVLNSIDLFNLVAQWMPDAATRQKVLVNNPARLFGF